MEKLQQPFSNMLSWILTELQDNQEDYISIVCKVNKWSNLLSFVLIRNHYFRDKIHSL